jgi:hypothetical protein
VELMASTMGEHLGWTIRVTPRLGNDNWSASLEAWPPGMDSRTHGAMTLRFAKTFDSETEAVNEAMASARWQIDQIEKGGPRQ